jgi:hypothetical protein
LGDAFHVIAVGDASYRVPGCLTRLSELLIKEIPCAAELFRTTLTLLRSQPWRSEDSETGIIDALDNAHLFRESKSWRDSILAGTIAISRLSCC